MTRRNRILSTILLGSALLGFTPADFALEDLNPESDTFGQLIGPSYFLGDPCVIFFGHES